MRTVSWGITILLLMVMTPVAAGESEGPEGPVTVDALAWLSGCWSHDGREAGSVEHWLPPAGGVMLAVSRIVRNGQTVSHEFLQIEETGDGGLQLTALPAGQQATVFGLTTLGADLVVFENPAHDFPQRIGYRLAAQDRLVATADAGDGDERNRIDFPMTRTPCLSVD